MFAIRCTTCQAKIAVHDDRLIGTIVACPKCRGMVLVEKPPVVEIDSTASACAQKPDQGDKPLSIPHPPDFPIDIPMEVDLSEPETPASGRRPESLHLPDSERQRRKRLLQILVFLIGLLLFGMVLFLFFGGVENEELPVVPAPAASRPVLKAEQAELVLVAEKKLPDSPEPPQADRSPETDASEQPDISSESQDSLKDSPVVNALASPAPLESNALPAVIEKTEEEPVQAEPKKTLQPGEQVGRAAKTDPTPHLDLPLQEIAFEQVPLLEIVRTLSDLVHVPFTFDLESFRAKGISLTRLLSFEARDVTVKTLLRQLVEPLGIEFFVEEGQITLRVAAAPTALTWDITDLQRHAEKPLSGERIRGDLEKLLAPSGPIHLENGLLRVEASPETGDKALRFLEMLRFVRGMPGRSALSGEQVAPEAFGWDTVSQRQTLNYFEPTPLDDVFSLLEKATPLHIVVDHRALHREGIALKAIRTTIHSDNGTLNAALNGLLEASEPIPLTFRLIEKNLIEVTTLSDARSPRKMSIEVHRLPETADSEEYAETLRQTFEPESWGPEAGVIVTDHATGLLFIRQSQPVQRAIREYIEAPPESLPPESPASGR